LIGLAGVVVVVLVVASGCVLQGSWTTLTPAAPPSPPPGVTADPDFSDVSCPTEDFCLAVGAVVGDRYWEWSPLAERWDGSSWSVVDTSGLVTPDTAEFDYTERIDHVSCRSADQCVAAVSQKVEDLIFGGEDIYDRVYTWDGTAWTRVMFDYFEADDDKLIDCSTGGNCIVWAELNSEAAIWDGATWVETGNFADGPGSCAGQDFCVRNGQWAGYAEHWDGATWTIEPLPEENFAASAIDCTSPVRCVAVGILDSDFDEVGELASALWNGTEWTMPEVPVAGEGTFDGVSCVGGECVGLGTAEGERVTLAFSGNKWYEVEDTPGGADTVYEDLSCVGLSCLAVGWSGPKATSSLVAAEYVWTRD
jgi:hypothetical protein